MNIDILKYKWENGVYNKEDLIEMVEKGQITKQDYFEITRHKYIQKT